MKKDGKLKDIFDNRRFQICLIFMACFISLIFILKKGIVPGHDLEYHLSRINGLAKCLKNWDLKGLIHPGFYDYGYANGLFYSNLFLYFPAIINLLGLDVISDEGENLGKLDDIYNTGSNDIYVVKNEMGKQILLPAIKEVIKNVDLENKKITVHIINGLL